MLDLYVWKRQLTDTTSNDEHEWAIKAGRLLQKQRYSEALTFYRQAQEDMNSEPAVWRRFSRALSRTKQLDDALIAVDRAVKQDPTSEESWTLRAIYLSKLERPEEAITSFEQAFEHAKEDASRAILLRGIGNAQWELKRYQQGLETLDRAIALDPTDAPSWNNRGNCLADLGRYEEALASYEHALSLFPEYAVAWNNKGDVLRKLKRYPEALAALDRAIELAPDLGLCWLTKAETLREMEAYEDAVPAYERAIALHHQPVRALTNCAVVLQRLQRHSDVLRMTEQALRLAPDSALIWTTQAISLASLGRYEEALECLDHAFEHESSYAEALLCKAQIFRAQRRYEEALELFRLVSQMQNKSLPAYAGIYATALKLRRFREAFAASKRIVVLGLRGTA